MCDLNIAQDGPRKPVHLNIIDIKSLEKSIQDYMSKISEVDIKQLMYTSSPEDFVDAFRKGFDFAEHNFLENGNGILCYDLMICQNPLDEQKKQLFYTFFSQDSVYEKKLRLAKIYQYYLDFYPEYHIDTMLQICYTENCDDIKEGFYLKFEDAGCKMFSLGNSEENDKELKSFDLNGNRLSDCEPYIPDMSNIDEDGIIEKVIGKFEKYIDDNTKRTVDEKSEYVDYVSAFLDKKTPIGKDRDRNVSLKQIQNNAYRISLINELAVPGIKCLYFIPISFPNHKQIGHFVLSTDGTDLKRDKEYIKKFKVLSFVLMFPLSQVNVSSIFMKKAYNESVKSAKAAIMSRNMSHNLGSHVMAYLKNDLRNVPSIFSSSVLHQLFPDHIKEEASKVSSEVELPFLVGLGNFIGYLQERQDYIATIASSYIPSFSPVNFKDSVYDELNPDLRFERHHGNNPNNHNRPQNILLSYIAKSEKLSRIKTGNANDHDILLGFKHKGKIFGLDPLTNNSSDESLTPMRIVNFALPGGIVGRQAIFSIVENIIRNAAKHNNVQGNLSLIFEVIDGEELKANPDTFESCISSKSIRSLYKDSVDIEDLIILTITDNQKCQNSTIDKLRTALRQPYIGENAETNKGVKEIRISATWLRGEDDETQFAQCPMDDNEQITSNKKAPTVVIEKSKEGHLRYSICLRKTYEFALVFDEKKKDDTKFENRFQLKYGSYKSIPASMIVSSDTCFEYIIAENTSVFNDIRPYVTNRCVNVEDIVTDESVKITPAMIYEAYTGINDESPCIVIDDDKVEEIHFKDKIKREMPSQGNRLFLYRSHHFSDKDFGAYWIDRANRKYPDNIACIDGITGDNSSDRLVRREKLNKKWYIGHLYAMQSRVAVFDERLFQIVHGLDESQMTLGSYLVSKLSNLCMEGKWPNKKLNETQLEKLAINELNIQKFSDIDTFVELYSVCLEAPDRRDEAKQLSNRRKMVNFLEPFCFKYKEHVEGHQHLTAAYAEKGVDVYTIIPLGNRECLIVGSSSYDYKYESNVETGDTPVYNFSFEPIAHIWRDEKKAFHIEPLNNYSLKKFKYVSIHQGLIDKMYTEFGIEDKDEASKKALMHTLYNGIMAGMDIENNDSFMPRLTIHSGRGHITRKDMPNNQPFLQYSAIEHAVLDCKYALVELLDFAKFKKS